MATARAEPSWNDPENQRVADGSHDRGRKNVGREPTFVVPPGFPSLAVVGLHDPVASGAHGLLQSGACPGQQRDLAVTVARERDFTHAQGDLPGSPGRVPLEANVADLATESLGDLERVAACRLQQQNTDAVTEPSHHIG